MKKVKIMLAAILVMAIVAGSLAFKAKTFISLYTLTTTEVGTTTTFTCEFVDLYTTTGIIPLTTTLGTITFIEPETWTECTTTVTYYEEL